MKVKVSSSLEQMKNLEVGQLGIMTTWNTRINLVVFLGFNDRTMKGYFYALGPLAGTVLGENVDLDYQYLEYFMPKIVEYNLKNKLNAKYMISSDGKFGFDALDLPKIDIRTWYVKNRMIDNSLPELCSRLSIWGVKYVKPKDLVVGKIYARKDAKNYYLYVYMGKHIIKGEERYVLVKYDNHANYEYYMDFLTYHPANVVAFRHAPTNCIELDDINDANIKASQAIIMSSRELRMVK